MAKDMLPPKGHLSKQFMAVALTVVMGAAAVLGAAGPAQAQSLENPLPTATNSIGQVVNTVTQQVVNGAIYGQPMNQVLKNAGKQGMQTVGQGAGQDLGRAATQVLNKIFTR